MILISIIPDLDHRDFESKLIVELFEVEARPSKTIPRLRVSREAASGRAITD
jgi:hypothetical protein